MSKGNYEDGTCKYIIDEQQRKTIVNLSRKVSLIPMYQR